MLKTRTLLALTLMTRVLFAEPDADCARALEALEPGQFVQLQIRNPYGGLPDGVIRHSGMYRGTSVDGTILEFASWSAPRNLVEGKVVVVAPGEQVIVHVLDIQGSKPYLHRRFATFRGFSDEGRVVDFAGWSARVEAIQNIIK